MKTRAQLAKRVDDLWSEHEGAVSQRLEGADRKALDNLAKVLNMPRHIRRALDWSYTRAMIGSGDLGQTPSAIATGHAYDCSRYWVLIKWYLIKQLEPAGGLGQYLDRLAELDGSCAGYLFAAKETVGHEN